MTTDLETRCKSLLVELKLGSPNEITAVEPLTGGVASDIAVVQLNDKAGSRKLCMKFALAKLRVAQDWFAPVDRNHAEYQYLTFSKSVVPASAPELFGCSLSANGFAMEYVAGDDVTLWKSALLDGQIDEDWFASVGSTLGLIQAESARSPALLEQFDNQDDFHAIRIEPYLSSTATHYPGLKTEFEALEAMLGSSRRVLVHGDVSPKNILFKGHKPMLLDAECASVGDASFDIAFCLNHIVLKSIKLTEKRLDLLRCARILWESYVNCVDWEPRIALEARVCQLLPALMLARADGKSPVEYLTTDSQGVVRDIAVPLLTQPVSRLSLLLDRC